MIENNLDLQKVVLQTGKTDAIDMRPVFGTMNVYEDVYSNFITGTISLQDSVNLPTNHQITGHENLKLKFKGKNVYNAHKANEPWIDLDLCVHGISERSVMSTKLQEYTLHFSSYASLKNNLVKVSQAFSENIPNIINNIWKTYIDEPVISDIDSPTGFSCVVPHWPPAYAVNWLSERCLAGTPQNGIVADCLFYEDRGTFRLSSLSALKLAPPTLIDPQSGSTLYYNIPGLLPEFHYSRQRNVESFTVQPSFDTMIATRHGVYGAQAVTHDITRKKLVYHTPFNYETDFAKRPHLAKYNMVPSSGLANQKKVPGQLSNYSQSGYGLYPKQSYLYDGAIHVKYPEMYIFQRNSQLSQTKTMTIGVLIPGDTSIRLGSVIAWKHFPSFEQSTEGVPQPKDELLSGNFLVTAINHILEPGHYKMMIELTKDSVGKDLK